MLPGTRPCDDTVESVISDCEAGSEAEEGRDGPLLADHARAAKKQRVWQWRPAVGVLWGVAAGALLVVALSRQGTARTAGETGEIVELVINAEEVNTNKTKPIEAKKEKKEDCKKSFSCVCRSCACNETTQCYQDVHYAKDTAFKDHPEWYVGLKNTSTFAEFQEYFSKQEGPDGDPRCPKPCPGALPAVDGGKDDASDEGKKTEATGCHTPVKGESCYNHVTYTLTGLEKKLKKHPSWYPGLTAESSFEEVQCLLHFQKVCPKPCGLAKEKEEKIKSAGHF